MASCIVPPVHGYALYVRRDARRNRGLHGARIIVECCNRRADVEEGIVNSVLGYKRRDDEILGR